MHYLLKGWFHTNTIISAWWNSKSSSSSFKLMPCLIHRGLRNILHKNFLKIQNWIIEKQMIRSVLIANRRWQKMAILKLNKIRIYYLNNTLLLAAYWWGINWCLVIHFCKNTYVARAAAGKFMHNCDKRERWHGKHPLALSRSTWCLIKISKWSKKYSYLLYYYYCKCILLSIS